MRRRVTYDLGGHFKAPHKSMLFLSYLSVPGGHFRSSLGALRARFDVLASLFDAQAAQIRVGVLFYFFVQKYTPYLLCAGCVHTLIMELLTLRRPLVDAQAAQIRVGVIFYVFVLKQTHHLLCAGCVHTRHR